MARSRNFIGNFYTDQMVVEFTKISQKQLKTIGDLKQNTGKPRGDMDEQNWRGLKWFVFQWVNLKNVGPPIFIFISVDIKMSFTELENHS